MPHPIIRKQRYALRIKDETHLSSQYEVSTFLSICAALAMIGHGEMMERYHKHSPYILLENVPEIPTILDKGLYGQ